MCAAVDRFYEDTGEWDEPIFCILCGIDTGGSTLCVDCDEIDYSK